MTTKDYELIADVISTMPNTGERVVLTLKLCHAFRKDNPRFSVGKFVARVTKDQNWDKDNIIEGLFDSRH